MGTGADPTLSAPAPARRQDSIPDGSKVWGVSLFWHVLPILAALALVVLLIVTSDFTWAQARAVLDALTFLHISGFITISFVMLWLSAVKWRLVMTHLPASDAPVPSLIAAFFYTCVGAVLSLVLMPHAAKPTGRALGARLHGRQPALKSAAASVFEQVFDLATILVLAAFGVALLAPALGPLVAVALAVGAGAAVFLAKRPHLMPKRLHMADLSGLLSGPVTPRLATISLVLYLLTALRAGIVAVPAGLILLPADFFASFSLVQLSRLIAVTPMGLGIADWTWAGVLSLLDMPLAVAAGFVLLNRSLNALSILAAFGVSLVLILFDRRPAP